MYCTYIVRTSSQFAEVNLLLTFSGKGVTERKKITIRRNIKVKSSENIIIIRDLIGIHWGPPCLIGDPWDRHASSETHETDMPIGLYTHSNILIFVYLLLSIHIRKNVRHIGILGFRSGTSVSEGSPIRSVTSVLNGSLIMHAGPQFSIRLQ